MTPGRQAADTDHKAIASAVGRARRGTPDSHTAACKAAAAEAADNDELAAEFDDAAEEWATLEPFESLREWGVLACQESDQAQQNWDGNQWENAWGSWDRSRGSWWRSDDSDAEAGDEVCPDCDWDDWDESEWDDWNTQFTHSGTHSEAPSASWDSDTAGSTAAKSLRQATVNQVKGTAPLGRGEMRAIGVHSENHRQGRVVPYAMNKKAGAFTDWQQRQRAASTPKDIFQVWSERQEQVKWTLSDTYMKARCGCLRRWIWQALECFGQTPWRYHWPAGGRLDQRMMLAFVTEASIRYKDKVSIEGSKIHIEQFHADNGWMPPPFPAADHFIRKVSKRLLIEYPEGRAIQGAFTPATIGQHLQTLRRQRDELWNANRLWQAADLHEVIMALCATFEAAARAGNFCRGLDFKGDTRHWSKATIWELTSPHPQLQDTDVVAILMPPPPLKTANNPSAAAQERARAPVMFLTGTD